MGNHRQDSEGWGKRDALRSEVPNAFEPVQQDSLHSSEISLGKVVAFVEQGHASGLSHRIGYAVSEI